MELAKQFELFKKGESEAPIVRKDVSFKVNEDGKQVVLTVEELDRDGEVVEILGGKFKQDVPMIDSHNMYGNVTTNGLGAVRNLRVEEVSGKKRIVGEPDFAPTPNGQIARTLYMGVDGGRPYFTDVSMGFAVYDYDNETRTIKEWELFELSLVTVGANRGARFEGKSVKEQKEDTNIEEQMAKDLARFKQIEQPYKEVTKLFLSEKFCKLIGYEKDGDMVVDINAIYDIVEKQFSSALQVEAPQIEKQPDASRVIERAILDAISKLG